MIQKKYIIVLFCLLMTSTFIYAQDEAEERNTSATRVTKDFNVGGITVLSRCSYTSSNVSPWYETAKGSIPLGTVVEGQIMKTNVGYLSFDLSGIPGDAKIISATMSIKSIDNKSITANYLDLYEAEPLPYDLLNENYWNKIKGTKIEEVAIKSSDRLAICDFKSSNLTEYIQKKIGNNKTVMFLDLRNKVVGGQGVSKLFGTNSSSLGMRVIYEIPDKPVNPNELCGITIEDKSSKLQKLTYDNCNLTIGSTSLLSSNVASVISKKKISFAGSGSVAGSAVLSVKTDTEIDVRALNIQGNTKVSMVAGESVVLKSGFSASKGTNVSIKIQPKNILKSQPVDTFLDLDIIQQDEVAVKVYPNPTEDVLNIVGADIERVDVYSMNGRLVKSVVNTSSVDFQNLPSGIYIVKIKTPSGIVTERVVKK